MLQLYDISHGKTVFSVTHSIAKLTGWPAISFAQCLPQAGNFLFCFSWEWGFREKKTCSIVSENWKHFITNPTFVSFESQSANQI